MYYRKEMYEIDSGHANVGQGLKLFKAIMSFRF